MTLLLAVLLFVGVGVPAAIHALWGLGSTWPEETEEALARAVVGDGRRRMPPPWMSLAVAAVLGAVALWPFVLVAVGIESWALAIGFALAGVFVARGMAGYSPRWRAHFRDEPFATRDRRYYSPYCLLMGVGYLALLAGEMENL